MRSIEGLYAALITPYTKSGEVNYRELKKIVRFLIEEGINGFYACGSTAEAFLLTAEERKKIVETVVEEVQGEVPVIVHIGDIGTDKSLALGQHAKQVGADAISSVAPFYYKFSFEEVKGYYHQIVEACDLPMVVYNFPALSGVQFTLDQLDEMVSHPLIKGLKHTSQDLYQLERMAHRHPDLVVYNGFDEMLLSGLVAGAKGGIGSTYNCMPKLYHNLWQAYKEGRMEEAQAYQQKANSMIECIVKFGVMQSVKTLLSVYGFEDNGCRKPFRELRQEEVARLKDTFKTLI